MSLIYNLFAVIKANPLKEKILITNSHAQGHQWRECVSRELGPVSNVSVQTIEEFVYTYAKLPLRKANKTFMSDQESYWLIYSLINQLTEKQDFQFEANLLTPGFVSAFHRAIIDLRKAGLTSGEISPEQFEQWDKGRLIQQLLQGYEQYLHNHHLVDVAGLAPYLSNVNGQLPIVMVHEHVHLSFVEQDMLAKITNGQYDILKGDLPFYHADSDFPAAQTEFFHSTGILSELKEVFRRMASTEARFDEVEIIASDYEGTVSAAYALGQHFDIPITFSKGLPIQYTQMGKAAHAYLNWIQSNFDIEHMLKAFRDYLVRMDEDFTIGKITHLLEKLGIGWGQERYQLIAKACQTEEDEVNKKALEWTNQFFQQLFSALPNQEQYSPKAILAGLTHFLETYVSPKSKEEAAVLTSIRDLGTKMSAFEQMASDLDTAIEFVEQLLEEIRYQVSPIPEPGKVHFSSMRDGGYSGRLRTYIVGMDESNWSVTTRQDPILLDDERQRLSPHLKTSQVLSKENLQERDSRLGAIRKFCTVSFCSYSSIENEGKTPAYEMLQIYRKKCNNPEAEMNKLLEHLGEQIYFSGMAGDLKVNEMDVWLNSLIGAGKDVKNGQGILFGSYKSIAAGDMAIRSRKGMDITVYDGILNEGLQKEHFDALTLSVTHLEAFADCSLKFYFRNILGMKPKERQAFDRTRWLNPLDRGSLIHKIFYKYMTNRVQSGKINDPQDHDLLLTFTEETIKEFQEQIPAPSTHIAQKEIAEIYNDVEVFIKQEEHRHSTPRYLEFQLHPDDGYFEVELAGNLRIPLRGIVDRVDELEPHVYRIYDYKTGNPSKFEKAKYFGKGTQLQHALYALAVEKWLQNGDDPKAVVKESVYYFPTQKGLGKEVIRQQNQRELLAQLVSSMLDAIQKGTFLPTTDSIKCTYCDFKDVCGEHSKWTKEKQLDDPRLQSLMGVRDYD